MRFRPVEAGYDPRDRHGAWHQLKEADQAGEILTGILYLNPAKPDFDALLNLTETPLAQLPDSLLRPPRESLDAIKASLR